MRVDVQRDAVPICWALVRIGDRFVASVLDPSSNRVLVRFLEHSESLKCDAWNVSFIAIVCVGV